MFEDFDFFSQMDSVDYSTFEPAFTWGDFDAGFTIPQDSGFDLGGIGDAGSWSDGWGVVDEQSIGEGMWDTSIAQDGSYISPNGYWDYGDVMESGTPGNMNGVIWEPDFPISGDGFNLPNISAGQVLDVGKQAASVYTMTQSGSKPRSTQQSNTAAGASTNGSAFQSIIGAITGTIKAGAQAVANIEDIRDRTTSAKTVNTARGAASGILGPRTTTTRGTAVTRSNAPASGGFQMSPAVIALGALAGVLVLRG
jgi:hypothetical protein